MFKSFLKKSAPLHFTDCHTMSVEGMPSGRLSATTPTRLSQGRSILVGAVCCELGIVGFIEKIWGTKNLTCKKSLKGKKGIYLDRFRKKNQNFFYKSKNKESKFV